MKAIESFFEDTIPGKLIATACALGLPLMMVILL